MLPGSGHGIGGVIIVRPSIGAVGETSVSKVVDDSFVWVFLGPHEHQTTKDQTGARQDGLESYCSSVCGHPLSSKTERVNQSRFKKRRDNAILSVATVK